MNLKIFSHKNTFNDIQLIFSGLGFRPLPPEDNVESTLIWYRGTNKENYEVWTNALDEFLHRKYHDVSHIAANCLPFLLILIFMTLCV